MELCEAYDKYLNKRNNKYEKYTLTPSGTRVTTAVNQFASEYDSVWGIYQPNLVATSVIGQSGNDVPGRIDVDYTVGATLTGSNIITGTTIGGIIDSGLNLNTQVTPRLEPYQQFFAGTGSFAGNYSATIIPHNFGRTPRAATITPYNYDAVDIGRYWVSWDSQNIYVSNTGSATTQFSYIVV